MTSVFAKLSKRRAYPVDIDGEVVHVCEPTIGQIERISKLSDSQSTGLALALCLVDEEGHRLFETNNGETDDVLAARVLEEADGVTLSVMRTLSDAIMKLTRAVPAETLEKN